MLISSTLALPGNSFPYDIPHHINRIDQSSRREVRVSHRHLWVIMAQKLLHFIEWATGEVNFTRILSLSSFYSMI
jgi:hypothetical protein